MLIQIAQGTALVTQLIFNSWTGTVAGVGLPASALCPDNGYIDYHTVECTQGSFGHGDITYLPMDVDYNGDGEADDTYEYVSEEHCNEEGCIQPGWYVSDRD